MDEKAWACKRCGWGMGIVKGGKMAVVLGSVRGVEVDQFGRVWVVCPVCGCGRVWRPAKEKCEVQDTR